MMQKLKWLCFLILLVVPFLSFGVTIGDVAQNLMGPTSIVTKLLIVACYIVGMVLIFMALAQYKVHRQSPKLVPLTTPIALLILGVVAILIPYWTDMFETGKAESAKSQDKNVLPLPDVTQDRPGLPLPAPSRETERPKPHKQAPKQGSSGNGGGHWTSDPRYR